jgi:RNA polymerase sigma factor (sigma-70 family)
MKQEISGQTSDHSQIADLYHCYAPLLFAYLRLHLSSQEDIEDLLLEVFLAALECANLSGLPAEKQLAWLRRVAHNKLVDRYRNLARLQVVALEGVQESVFFNEHLAPEQVALRHEEQANLQKALNRLPLLQQQVLYLHFVNGLRCVEIARVLGKREGTVRVLLSRALNNLRNTYQE